MRFKKLSKEDKKFISKMYKDDTVKWTKRMSILSDEYEVDEKTIRRWAKKLGLTTGDRTGVKKSEQFEKAKKKVHKKSDFYFVTWAQNNTDIHKKMLTNMEAYADFLGAEILAIAGRYRNPTSLEASKNLKNREKIGEISWDSGVLPYLTANRHSIHKYIKVLSDVKVQPTAENPLMGIEGFSGLESSILGHPKQDLRSLPVLDGYPHKVLMSTGSITKKNFTDTKSGKKGEFNHVYGFLVVEIRDEEVFHIRNVNVDDSGEFNDLFFNVKNGKVTRNDSIENIVLGDLHCGYENRDVLFTTLDFLDVLKPENVVLHDVFDGYSISHHHEKDPFLKYKKIKENKHTLYNEINNLMRRLSEFEKYKNVHIVRSNHDEHIDRYLKERDWKKDIANSLEYMEMSTIILKGEAPKGIIPYLINEYFPKYNCLGINDSLMIKGIECGLHGDKGSNGSRGSANQFKRLNVKTITAHSHSPEIKSGAYVVGTTTQLRLEYNKGLSSWMNGHVITDNLGKRQQILFVDGEFTTLMDKLQ